MINIIAWLVFGLIAGAVAKFLKPGVDEGGWLSTIIIGIIGSLIGGFIGRMFFGEGISNDVFNIYSLLMAVLGSIIVLYIANSIAKR